jgi:hypothetical protein
MSHTRRSSQSHNDRRRVRRFVLTGKRAWLNGALAVMLTLGTLASAAPSYAATDVEMDKCRACERKYKDQQKAAKAAAPPGFVPAPDKNRRPTFMVDCFAGT